MTCPMQKNALMQWYTQYLSTENRILQPRGLGKIIQKDVIYMTMETCTSILIQWEEEPPILEVFAELVRNHLEIEYIFYS